ncbi:MAG: STAS domain-containing protein [Crocinitomix sp.]|nr:STAS domain-containing protein [Crocinitomix sp.]
MFNFKHLKGDIFGGLTAGIVALPLALAFGVTSGLGPEAGLYGAIFVSFFAALFGGTDTQISGPTAPMTAVSMVVIAGILATFEGDKTQAIPAIMMVFFLAGLMQIGLGVIGIGNYIKYIPYPVVSGFMTAIGVIILVTQLLPVIGYYPSEDQSYIDEFKPHAEEVILDKILQDEMGEGILVLEDFHETIDRAHEITPEKIQVESSSLASNSAKGVVGALKVLPRGLKNIKWLELWLALGTIFIIYGFRRITKAVPSTLVALVVMTGVGYLLKTQFGIIPHAITKIPEGLPNLNLEMFTGVSFGSLSPYILSALTLALLGAIDSLLTSVVADNMTKTKHKPNKELVGQGIGNSIASLFGGIPGAGATIRTVVNIGAGGKTRLSGMLAGVLLLIILLSLGDLANQIPSAVLAGILVTVGIGVMDYKGLKAIPNMPRQEVVIMLVVLVLASVWDLIAAVAIGLVIALFMFMKQVGESTGQKSQIKTLEDEPLWSDETAFPNNLKEEVAIKHVNGPLFFGSTSDFQALAKHIPDTATTVILRLDKMDYMDQSGLYAMEDLLVDLAGQGTRILIVGLQKQPCYMFERVNLIPKLVAKEFIFKTFEECLVWIKTNVKDTVQ